MAPPSLAERLEKIKQVFSIEDILNRPTDLAAIAHYYHLNRKAYARFHNKEGFIHMGLSQDGAYTPSDLLAQAEFVAHYLPDQPAEVLELATGKGANCVYLAKRFPQSNFLGLDLPKDQIQDAETASATLPNFTVQEGDFHHLGHLQSDFFDCVFVVEGLCHSTDKANVLTEVLRVTKPGGRFIIIDAYWTATPPSPDEALAQHLTTKGMLVDDFEVYAKFRAEIVTTGWQLTHEENASTQILPSLRRFESLAGRALFNHPTQGRLVRATLPPEITANAISAYLMPYLVEHLLAQYMLLVLQKPATRFDKGGNELYN